MSEMAFYIFAFAISLIYTLNKKRFKAIAKVF